MASIIHQSCPICVDGRMLEASATGVGTYADTLLKALREGGAKPLVLEAEGRPRSRIRRWMGSLQARSRFARHDHAGNRLTAGPELFREAQIFFDVHRRVMPVETDAPPGIMHWTYPVPLRMKGWMNVYTVHDAIPLTRASLTPIDRGRHRRLLRNIVGSADRLLAVSNAARQDIVSALGCDGGLVTTIFQGVAPLPTAGMLPIDITPGEYFLFCGSLEPRKNLVRLVEAHAASGSARPLILAGPDGWRAREILAAIAGRPGILRLPYQTRESLGALLSGARALLFPSLAEGFGLPVAEAMMAGTPVMTSSAGALAEVAGGAALLVDVADIRGMAEAIVRLDRDDGLITALSEAGRRQAAAFSIAAYADRLARFHADLAGGQA